MKVHATSNERVDCPKCKGVAYTTIPEKMVDSLPVIYGCTVCGFAFDKDGKELVDSAKGLRDIFQGATKGNEALTEGLSGANLSPAVMTLLNAKIMTYGCDMWLDGLKQGLLLGAVRAHKERKNDNG